jgi:broad specificity phosphatase PhoE
MTQPSERVDPPEYLARFKARSSASSAEVKPQPTNGVDATDELSADGARAETPLYLRRFRSRDHTDHSAGRGTSTEAETPLWQRSPLAVQQALTEDNRNKEIAAPPNASRAVSNDVYLIRHGETQGYSTDSGLTPQGAWQAHTYGNTLAKRVKSGEKVVFRHAETNRASETAEQIHRGFVDGLVQYEKDVEISAPSGMDEFRNFQFASPDGLKDVTAAFRQYLALLESHEREAGGDRPLWLVEMDRFWRTQQGGADPIQHWLTVPMIHFEPPAMCVRRFWSGISRLGDEHPGARLAIATHSGPIRAFAVTALGYDPGEPYNTEHVRVKILDTPNSDRDRDALVAYRNRVQDTRVPDVAALPQWQVAEDWAGF